ncbi:protein YoaL [Citrobacter enshiensis]|uniref:protein YoaL n=1 Tax=Citrobacter enshiensis TaxID=2971264 RepID=UPI00399D5D65
MDRHRRHFTFRPLCACHSGNVCHNLNLHIALSAEMFSAPSGYSLSRSLSWNS